MNTALDALIASSTLTVAVLDKLVRKNVLTRADAGAVMDDAARQCEALSPAAAEMIRTAKTEMMRKH